MARCETALLEGAIDIKVEVVFNPFLSNAMEYKTNENEKGFV